MQRHGLDVHTLDALALGDHGDPFAVLGPHAVPGLGTVLRCLQPRARSVTAVDAAGRTLVELDRIHHEGVFAGVLAGKDRSPAYRLRVELPWATIEIEDPYRFGPVLGELDIYLLAEGTHLRSYERLGAHPRMHEGVEGTAFAVWAPNARRVSVVGDFNEWDGRVHPMRLRHSCGVWEIFVPAATRGARYKFEIKGADGRLLPLKADPCGFRSEHPPATASIVAGLPGDEWSDASWMASRGLANDRAAPISIYEVHLGSWRRGDGNTYLDYDALADQLIPYVQDLGFTHIELMPVSEFPFDGSWGYQPIGLFAPTSRFGDPAGFKRFVERAHAAGIGIFVDWVPGHFPTDAHGLGLFDGTHLYEHADPRLGFHMDWNTLIYNFGRTEVTNFLISNALYWLEHFHVDGLRVDAVASMLYLDYSRKEGEWVPNAFGGRENLDAISFLKRTNEAVFSRCAGATTAAEESTAWPGVSRPTYAGGLGFGFKWNMGWMHDTLQYMGREPIHRRHHHHEMTFGLLYGFSENFILPLSHDEVVHGKGSLIGRMPGDAWQKFANLRAYFGFMWTHPGKKLLFMGGEFGQWAEWNHDQSLDWHLLDKGPFHRGLQALVRDLNRLYRATPALHALDCEPDGFQWVEGGDSDNSVFSYLRLARGDEPPVLVVANFTPVPRHGYRLGVPAGGAWREILNTDDAAYGGSGVGNGDAVAASPEGLHGRPFSLGLTLPPLGTIVLVPESAPVR